MSVSSEGNETPKERDENDVVPGYGQFNSRDLWDHASSEKGLATQAGARQAYWPPYRPLVIDEGIPLPPPASKKRRNVRTWVIFGLPWLMLFVMCGGVLGGISEVFNDCEGASPPEDVLDPLPPEARVISNEVDRGCMRLVVLKALDGDVDRLTEDLLYQLKANKWVLSEGESGWDGFKRGEKGDEDLALNIYRSGSRADDTLSVSVSVGSVGSIGTVYGGRLVLGELVSQPRFVGDTVVAMGGDEVVGYEARIGMIQWRTRCLSASWASVFGTPATDIAVVACSGDYTGIRVSDGSVVWTYPPPQKGPDRVRVMNGTLMLNSDGGLFQAVDAGTGKLRFERTDLGSSNGAANGSGVYASNRNGVLAYDLSGTQKWFRLSPSSGLYASEDAVFARTNTHEMLAFDTTRGELLWQSASNGDRLEWSDIVGVSDNTVVVYTTKPSEYITVYDRSTGAKLWERDVPADDQWFPSVGAGDLVVIAESKSGLVRIVDDRTGTELKSLEGAPGERAAVSNGRVAYVSLDGTKRKLEVSQVR